jgi:hypothetical protein
MKKKINKRYYTGDFVSAFEQLQATVNELSRFLVGLYSCRYLFFVAGEQKLPNQPFKFGQVHAKN